MANYIASDIDFISVADAIRAKGGTSASLSFPSGFVNAIEAFPEATTLDNLSVTSNGTYTPSSGHAFGEVSVNVAGVEDGIIDRTISGNYVNTTAASVGEEAFLGCMWLSGVSFYKCSLVAKGAFSKCIRLIEANFPECTYVDNAAFSSCANLRTISFPKCETLGNYAFYSCSALTQAIFPSCKIINPNAFASCQVISKIDFSRCENVGTTAFARCYNLLSAYFTTPSVPTLVNSNAFTSTPIAGYTASAGGVVGSIFVRASLLTAFQSATNWAYFSNRMVGLTDEEIAALEE